MLNQASVNTIPVNGYAVAPAQAIVPLVAYWDDSYVWPIDSVVFDTSEVCIGIDTVTPYVRVDCVPSRASLACCK